MKLPFVFSGPFKVKPTLVGALFRKLSATVAGNTSVNRPKPPRTTVLLPEPNGDQEKPTRGFTVIAWNPGNAWCWPLVSNEEYAVAVLVFREPNVPFE